MAGAIRSLASTSQHPIETFAEMLHWPADLYQNLTKLCSKCWSVSCERRYFETNLKEVASSRQMRNESNVVVRFANRFHVCFSYRPAVTAYHVIYEVGGLSCLWMGCYVLHLHLFVRTLFRKFDKTFVSKTESLVFSERHGRIRQSFLKFLAFLKVITQFIRFTLTLLVWLLSLLFNKLMVFIISIRNLLQPFYAE